MQCTVVECWLCFGMYYTACSQHELHTSKQVYENEDLDATASPRVWLTCQVYASDSCTLSVKSYALSWRMCSFVLDQDGSQGPGWSQAKHPRVMQLLVAELLHMMPSICLL